MKDKKQKAKLLADQYNKITNKLKELEAAEKAPEELQGQLDRLQPEVQILRVERETNRSALQRAEAEMQKLREALKAQSEKPVAKESPFESGAASRSVSPQSPTLQDIPVESDDSDDNDVRKPQADIIAYNEKLIATMQEPQDTELIAICKSRITKAKLTITLAKPLAQQIASLEAYLDRKASRILECQKLIIETDDTMQQLQADLIAKRADLAELKTRQLTELAGAPVQVGPDQTLTQQVEALKQAFNLLAPHITLAALPVQVQSVITSLASITTAPGTSATAQPVAPAPNGVQNMEPGIGTQEA